MARPKNWDEMSEEARQAWRAKENKLSRKYYEANREKK
jgi:hypothetical protein